MNGSATQSYGLEDVIGAYLAWSRKTFPWRGEGSVVAHLKRELAELEENPSDQEEMADIVMLVFYLADQKGIDMTEALRRKLLVNLGRKWKDPDEEGVVEHVKGA